MVVGARYSCMCSLCDQMHGCFIFLLVVVLQNSSKLVTFCNFVALVMKFRFTVVEKKTLPILNATLSEALK